MMKSVIKLFVLANVMWMIYMVGNEWFFGDIVKEVHIRLTNGIAGFVFNGCAVYTVWVLRKDRKQLEEQKKEEQDRE